MSRRIVIAGAGGFGRGVLSWISSSPRHLEHYEISEIVFIDDGRPAVTPQAPVVSTIRGYAPEPTDAVLCAVGVPDVRRTVVQSLVGAGAQFHTFVDDRAVIGGGVTIGEGSIICPGAVISANVSVGAHVHVNFNCSVGHDTELGALTTLSPAVNIMGEVVVGEGAFFGGSAVILPRITVGDRSVVGAGAVIIRNTEPFGIYVGSPARLLRKVEALGAETKRRSLDSR